MSTEIVPHGETMANMREAANNAAKGLRDPEEMRKAAEEMDRIGKEIFKRNGILDVAEPQSRTRRERLFAQG